jgi:hypothetical protein
MHSSTECKLMAGDTARFTAALHSSTGPNQPPGGSTKVLGQEWELREMTANAMSSAPANSIPAPDRDDYQEAADLHTEAFLANLMLKVLNGNDGYTSADEDPVQITANMMANDDLWLLYSYTADDSTQSDPGPQIPPPLEPTATNLYLKPMSPPVVPISRPVPVDSTPLSYLIALRANRMCLAITCSV